MRLGGFLPVVLGLGLSSSGQDARGLKHLIRRYDANTLMGRKTQRRVQDRLKPLSAIFFDIGSNQRWRKDLYCLAISFKAVVAASFGNASSSSSGNSRSR